MLRDRYHYSLTYLRNLRLRQISVLSQFMQLLSRWGQNYQSASIWGSQILTSDWTHKENTVNSWMNEWICKCAGGPAVTWESSSEQDRKEKMNQMCPLLRFRYAYHTCIPARSRILGNSGGSCQKAKGLYMAFLEMGKKGLWLGAGSSRMLFILGWV